MAQELLLVGSSPLDSVKEAFEIFGGTLGRHLFALPDGEVGPRRHWISRVHYQVFAGHPELEIARRPAPENGVERLDPRNASDSWLFRVKDGVDQVRFGDPGWRLGYAREANNSYAIFQMMKEKGALPSHLRFQVCLPMVNSLVPPRLFPNISDLEKIKPGVEAALRAEVAKIVELIPAKDLAIQWDCSTEVQDAYGAVAKLSAEDRIERNLQQVRALAAPIPEDVALGYHFCFGTLGGWPRFSPNDLSATVRLANAFVEASARRVDWIHIPVLNRVDDAFFAPLADLKPGGARVYLGAIHNMDTFAQRIAITKKYLPDFGLGAYCGLGRHTRAQLPGVMQEHLAALELIK
jgi:hypothetical protein